MTGRPPLIDYGRMLDVLGIEGELLLGAAEGALPDRAGEVVPGCPNLRLGETVRHVGSVYRATRQWVRDGQRPERWQRNPPDGDLVGYARQGLHELHGELARYEPSAAADTWWPGDRTHGFWRRRMAHETAVHRVDVQGAAGAAVAPVDEQVALDGIDEVLFVWFAYRLGRLGIASPAPGLVGLSAGGRHWVAEFEPGRSSAHRASESGAHAADALVRGDPMALYLWLWGRVPNQDVSITGDEDAAAQLWVLLRPATQ